MSEAELEAHLAHSEKVQLPRERLNKMQLSGLVAYAGARKTRADARRVIEQGGLQVNGVTQRDDAAVTLDMFLHGRYMVLKVGKKSFSVIEIVG